MKLAQVLQINHTFVCVRDDGTVEIVHHAADSIGNAFSCISSIVQDNLFAYSITVRPVALGKLLADHHLIWSAEHFLLIAREQLVVEEFKEVGGSKEHLCLSLLSFDGECHL